MLVSGICGQFNGKTANSPFPLPVKKFRVKICKKLFGYPENN